VFGKTLLTHHAYKALWVPRDMKDPRDAQRGSCVHDDDRGCSHLLPLAARLSGKRLDPAATIPTAVSLWRTCRACDHRVQSIATSRSSSSSRRSVQRLRSTLCLQGRRRRRSRRRTRCRTVCTR